MIENDWLDHEFISEHTVGFAAVAEHVHDWNPRKTAEVTGISERSVRQAAQWWGEASSSFLLHARGIEDHSHGVQNCLGAINMVLASGRLGREIFNELRVASKGGIADYSGITYEKIEKQFGVFWPCPGDDHPGTPRLFEPGSWNPIAKGSGPFYFPDGKARFNVAPYAPPAEETDDEYPLMLTTGRVVSQFLSGTQTRRIGPWLINIRSRRLKYTRNLRPSWASRTIGR